MSVPDLSASSLTDGRFAAALMHYDIWDHNASLKFLQSQPKVLNPVWHSRHIAEQLPPQHLHYIEELFESSLRSERWRGNCGIGLASALSQQGNIEKIWDILRREVEREEWYVAASIGIGALSQRAGASRFLLTAFSTIFLNVFSKDRSYLMKEMTELVSRNVMTELLAEADGGFTSPGEYGLGFYGREPEAMAFGLYYVAPWLMGKERLRLVPIALEKIRQAARHVDNDPRSTLLNLSMVAVATPPQLTREVLGLARQYDVNAATAAALLIHADASMHEELVDIVRSKNWISAERVLESLCWAHRTDIAFQALADAVERRDQNILQYGWKVESCLDDEQLRWAIERMIVQPELHWCARPLLAEYAWRGPDHARQALDLAIQAAV